MMAMTPQQRFEIFSRLRSANPSPRSELSFGFPFDMLLAVELSPQSTGKSVNLATAGLFQAANTPAAMLQLGRKRLERHIKRICLYRTKAKNLTAACQLLLERHEGSVP